MNFVVYRRFVLLTKTRVLFLAVRFLALQILRLQEKKRMKGGEREEKERNKIGKSNDRNDSSFHSFSLRVFYSRLSCYVRINLIFLFVMSRVYTRVSTEQT